VQVKSGPAGPGLEPRARCEASEHGEAQPFDRNEHGAILWKAGAMAVPLPYRVITLLLPGYGSRRTMRTDEDTFLPFLSACDSYRLSSVFLTGLEHAVYQNGSFSHEKKDCLFLCFSGGKFFPVERFRLLTMDNSAECCIVEDGI
jgi:hypothetical protein